LGGGGGEEKVRLETDAVGFWDYDALLGLGEGGEEEAGDQNEADEGHGRHMGGGGDKPRFGGANLKSFIRIGI
jgi:hypothetical protein